MKKAKNMPLWILAIMFVLCFVIKDIEAVFIPPASPAMKKTLGVVSVNGRMFVSSAVRD